MVLADVPGTGEVQDDVQPRGYGGCQYAGQDRCCEDGEPLLGTPARQRLQSWGRLGASYFDAH